MVTLTKFEQSAFLLHSSVANQTFGFDFGIFSREQVPSLPPMKGLFISHVHADHYSAENVKAIKAEKVFASAEVRDDLQQAGISSMKLVAHDLVGLGAIEARVFEVDHGPISKPISNLGFAIQIEDKRILFCGDMKVAALVPDVKFDVVLVPVCGGAVIFDAAEAMVFLKGLQHPGMVIPIHYHGQADPESGDRFARLCAGAFNVKVLQVNETIELS